MGVTSNLKRYLHSLEFRRALVRRYQRFEILSEGGLRTTVANLLRAKIQKLGHPSDVYRVTCETRLYLPDVQVIPDILVWKGKHPRIWIELKDTRGFNRWRARHDWQKLQDYCDLCPSVKAGYLIYVTRIIARGLPIKRGRETLRHWPIPIALEPHIPDFEQWELEYTHRAHYKPTQREPQPESQRLRRAAARKSLKERPSRKIVSAPPQDWRASLRLSSLGLRYRAQGTSRQSRRLRAQ